MLQSYPGPKILALGEQESSQGQCSSLDVRLKRLKSGPKTPWWAMEGSLLQKNLGGDKISMDKISRIQVPRYPGSTRSCPLSSLPSVSFLALPVIAKHHVFTFASPGGDFKTY